MRLSFASTSCNVFVVFVVFPSTSMATGMYVAMHCMSCCDARWGGGDGLRVNDVHLDALLG